jgi:hypothetical protein
VPDSSQRLAAWHPVIQLADSKPLKLGHLSDVHINVRHNALAESPAKLIEDPAFEQPPVGRRVCNSFNALKALFDQIGASGKPDTLLLLTGDLIDFNRNIDPARVPNGIAGQWKTFNVLNNINTEGLYPRGQDDMLAFSLVRYAYNELKLPVLMTSGNHEAYSVPYGISPRINDWGGAMGVLEDRSDTLGNNSWGRERKFTPTQTVGVGSGAHQINNIGPSAEAGRVLVNKFKNLNIKDLAQTYRDFDSASAWHNNKANEGIAADHNMTIYEATLAYGPTYAQALTGNNYDNDNFDWFGVLFTPLEDVLVALGAEPHRAGPATQVIAALGWGQGENFKNLSDVLSPDTGVDRQGAGILPRATASFSKAQLALLSQAQSHKRASPDASLTVASHFTIVNYGEALAYSAPRDETRFVPAARARSVLGAPAGFNQVNTGTCEINQDQYFSRCVRTQGQGSGPGIVAPQAAVDWHFSGHSHRAGVYTVAGSAARGIEVVSARDPGIQGEQTARAREHTRFIVTSSGGPIGKQNLDHELDGWTLRPPAGTLLEPASGRIRQVHTQRSSASAGAPWNEKPRLCVALDYMAAMSRHEDKHIDTPLALEGAPPSPRGWKVALRLSRTLARLDCIEGVRVWVFEGGKDAYGKAKLAKWHILKPAFEAKGTRPSLAFAAADHALLSRALSSNGVNKTARGFCEVLLKRPKAGADDWSRDMDCEDPWMFPLEIVQAMQLSGSPCFMRRPAGERGEVPDWKFLALNYEDRGYVPALEAITGKRQRPQ